MINVVNLTTDIDKKVFDKWATANFSGDKIEINDNGTISYYFFIPGFPFCTDGYKFEIKDEIEKRGYSPGLGNFVYKENISHSELIECLIFKSAYEFTYFSEIGDKHLAHLRDLQISVSEFMKKIDENTAKIKKAKIFRLDWKDIFLEKKLRGQESKY